jgi:hypothetical protein
MRILHVLTHGLRKQPRYTLMRALARFATIRTAVAGTRALLHASRHRTFLSHCDARMDQSVFRNLDRESFVAGLRRDGVAMGLALPAELVQEIVEFAARNPSFADRIEDRGIPPGGLEAAQARLGKPILLAQYFNAQEGCPAIARLAQDPMLQWIAASYLGSLPSFVGSNLWWTYPVDASPQDRDLHAHLFHRDVDDFRFFKFFFYLTDVRPGEGAHVLVQGSHRRPPATRGIVDRWNIRRYADDEIALTYAPGDVLEITGPAGTGFAENTLCVHRGRTPVREARLLLQLQYALFDYGLMHDRRPPESLRLLPAAAAPGP